MKGIKFAGTFFAFFFALILLTPSVRASETDQMTQLTFNQPIQIPGRVLPAGTYWFAVTERIEDHDIVYVYNADPVRHPGSVANQADDPNDHD